MAKQVFCSKLAKEIVRVVSFQMTVTGKAVVKEGTDLTKFLESQEYVIDPTNKSGTVVELTIGDIKELANEAAVVSPEPASKKMGRPAKVKAAVKPATKKRTMSPAAKAKIAASQKARWKKIKAAKAAPKKAAPKKKAVKKSKPKVKVTVKKVSAAEIPAPTADVSAKA